MPKVSPAVVRSSRDGMNSQRVLTVHPAEGHKAVLCEGQHQGERLGSTSSVCEGAAD